MSGFSINRVVLSGNLTRDPELRSLPSGSSLCSLRIANNTSRKDSNGEWQDKPNYFDVTVWSGMGEWVAKNLHKGATIIVEGRIEWREWEHEGQKRQAYDVVADSVVTANGNGKREATEETIGGIDPLDELSTEEAREAAAAAKTSAGTPAAGSLEATEENVKAHCICKPGFPNDNCPVAGHGVPF